MVMEELIKNIRGDWFEIREKGTSLLDLESLFHLTASQLEVITEGLRISVEEGIVEYKQSLFNGLLRLLEGLKYDSRGFDRIREQALSATYLTYITLAQKLLADGTLQIGKRGNSTGEQNEKEETYDIREVVKDIQERIQKNPEMARIHEVKNIFLQVNIYKKELGEMKKLEPTILPEKKASFQTNFKKTFDEITQKINNNYLVILQEERAKEREVLPPQGIAQWDLKGLVPLYRKQAADFSRIRSALMFAAKERYNTREILATIGNKKQHTLELLGREARNYRDIGPERAIARSICTEISALLVKEIAWLKRRGPQEGY